MLKESYGPPCRGIVTGLNAAFVIDRATRGHLIEQDARSTELLMPFLERKDLKKWHIQPRDLWLIYIPKNRLNIDDYPAIHDWLLPFKERLNKRATRQEWFEIQQAQLAYSEKFKNTKIIYPVISQGAKFSMEKFASYSNDKTFFLPTGDSYLLGLLNSKIIWFIVQGICSPLRGGVWRYELRAQQMEQQLDQAVYALFDLTPEGIELLQQNL